MVKFMNKVGRSVGRLLPLILFTLMCEHLLAQVTNQNLYDTIPNLPDHYKTRVEEFRKEPVVTGKIMFLGNSITEGGKWRELTGDQTVINRGIGGDVTFGILNRMDDIIIRKPSKVFILIGINDISKDFPEEVIAANYKKIIEQLKAGTPDTKIFIQSVLPLNPQYRKFPQHYDKVDHVIILNKLLKDLAIQQQVAFINLYPLFLDQQNRLDEKYTTDGLHLNSEGYKVWTKFLKENGYL
jgi:lysophospholipase L1-like esterase